MNLSYKNLLSRLLILLVFAHEAYGQQTNHPKLILMITVDQLRGDMPWRLQDRLSPDGFRYFMEQGVVYKNAHYQHSNTLTAVGHATLFTGGHSAQHGMVGNYWYDPAEEQQVYCVADSSYRIIGEKAGSNAGASPKNLSASTIGDELVLASANQSRVFSVSVKDRGAIIPGGHLGKAFWYSRTNGQFVSSSFYYDAYPHWVEEWNKAKKADQYQDTTWDLLHTPSSYIAAQQDDRSYEQSYKQLGYTFPHSLSGKTPKDYYSTLRFTPMADELTLDFAEALIKAEKIGQGPHTDMLAISFSVTDYVGHLFGPNSLEAEDNLLRLDRTLAKLLRLIDRQIGLSNSLIVLSSDHGTDAIPEYRKSLGFPAGKHHPEQLIARMNQLLKTRFSTNENLIRAYLHPNIYLNLQSISQLGIKPKKIENFLAQELMKTPGIALAVTRTDLMQGQIVGNPLFKKVQLAFHPIRSGNVLLVQAQFWYLNQSTDVAAVHGSPYAYDTHVPIMFAGKDIKQPKVVNRLVSPSDIVSTLAAQLNIPLPSGASGQPLDEVFSSDTAQAQ